MESESHRLVHSLTAHLALYHSHVSKPNPNSSTHRESILRWFSSLSSAHRQAALSVVDSSFIQIIIQMKSRLRRQGHSHFLLLPDLLSSSNPSLPSLSSRLSCGLLSRSAASNSSAFLFSSSLLFFSSSPSFGAADALTVSESLVTKVGHFVDVMDGITGGRFLCEEVGMAGLTVPWVELPWLKDMGYYTLEAFIANHLEVALRLSWFSLQGGKKPKEKRLKERAAEVAGKAANDFWRMKGCLSWWVGLDPGIRKVVISAFFGKATKALANEIINEDNGSLDNRFGFIDIRRNFELRYGGLSSEQKSNRSPFRSDLDFNLDFLPSRAPKKLAIIWKKIVVLQDISNMLLAWQSSGGEAEKLFFSSLGSIFTVSDYVKIKLQRLLMVVYTNLINYELMDDTKLSIYTGKKAEEKSNLVCLKGKSKSRSSKKSNTIGKSFNTTIASWESSKKIDGSSELHNNESTFSLVARRIIDSDVSLAINSAPEVKALAAQEEMDNANARVSNDCTENNGKRKHRRKGPKNKCSNLKNIGKPKSKDDKAFVSIAAEREQTRTIGYVCPSNTQPNSVDVSTCDNLLAPCISDVSQECVMVDVMQLRQDNEDCQSFGLVGDTSTTNEECHPFSGGACMLNSVSPCLSKGETSVQTTYSSSTDLNKPIDTQMGPAGDSFRHTCELDDVEADGKHEHLISRVARATVSKSFFPKKCLHTAANDRRSVMHNGSSECFTYGGIDSMAVTSYEWPSIAPHHFPSINSHLLPATDRLHLDVGVRMPYHSHQSFMHSKTHIGNSLSDSSHSQILPLTYPMSYDWPPMVKNCSILSQAQAISYESAYSQSLPSSFYSRLASCAGNGVQVNVASGDNEIKHAGDSIDVFDMKSISDFVEDESYCLSEDEPEPHARSGTDYNKYFGGGVMYWNPTELVGIGFSRPPSHSSEDSSWAWHEADLNRTIDDMVGCKSVLPTYTNGRASPPSSYCSPFDNLTSGHQSLGYAVTGNDVSSAIVHSTSLSYPSDDKISSSTTNSTSCIEGVKGDPFPYPILRPIIIPGMSRKGSRSDLKLGRDNKSPCLHSARNDNPRIRRPPSPVVLCVPRVPRPPLPSTVGESRKRGFPIVRSGSSSPRNWGVKSWCHEESIMTDTHLCLDGAEVVWPAWARKGLGVTAVAQSLQGSLLQDHLITIAQLAHDQEHPDVALPLQSPDILNGPWKGSLLMMHNLLHEEIDFFCKQVATRNLIRNPYINWAVRRVTRSLQVLWPRSRTNIFGSNATGLALPTSDVDLVVSLPPVRNLEPIKEAGILEGRNGIKETCLQHATRYLANQEWVRNDSLKAIENTAIPLIILVAEVPCDITLSHETSSLLDVSKDKSLCGEHSNASLVNLSGLDDVVTSKTSNIIKDGAVVGSKSVHLDISFKSTSHTGLQTSELVRELTQQFPASVPLALVLKKFLADRSLDHSYSGGLSSYCLVLLITRFLQHEHHCGHSMKQNLGSLLMDFLYFFGNVFDPRHMRISIQGSGVYMKRERGHSIDPIHIDDPLFPTNNVGRNCFRIHQCIKAFADAFTILENELPLISDESVPNSTQSFKLLKKIVPSIDSKD